MDTELQVEKWHIIKFVVIIVHIILSWKYGIEIFRGQSRRLTEWDNCNVVQVKEREVIPLIMTMENVSTSPHMAHIYIWYIWVKSCRTGKKCLKCLNFTLTQRLALSKPSILQTWVFCPAGILLLAHPHKNFHLPGLDFPTFKVFFGCCENSCAGGPNIDFQLGKRPKSVGWTVWTAQ